MTPRLLAVARRLATVERGLGLPTAALVRQHGTAVQTGPFAGLEYPRRLLPEIPWLAAKLTGAYEAELHETVERLVAGRPQVVVCIGAGDGLYAVGMARRLPAASVIAYELEPDAARLCAEVATANGVAARVDVRGACTPAELAELEPTGSVAVVCDCEGAEDELLDPQLAPWLGRATMLAEVHESFRPGVEGRLVERFRDTHELTEIESQPRFLEDYPNVSSVRGLSGVQRDRLINELRPWRTPWLLAEPRA